METTINRRTLFGHALCLLGLAAAAQAQPYPAKPITLPVPFAAGSTTDVIARLVTPQMQELLGQPVIVDNRPGAAGTIGTGVVARAPADGHTLLFTSAGHASSISLYPNITWHPVTSFSAVIMVGSIPNVIAVQAASPYKTLADFVGYVKVNPGKLNYAHTGIGTSQHLMTELLKQQAGLDLVQVPYKGSGETVTALMSGEVAMAPLGLLVAVPQAEAGTLRVLAVSSTQRASALPNVPTLKEAGYPDFDVRPWQAIFAPACTPRAVIDKLNGAFAKAFNAPEVKARLLKLGLQPDLGSPDEMAKFIQADVARWAKMIKQGGIRVE